MAGPAHPLAGSGTSRNDVDSTRHVDAMQFVAAHEANGWSISSPDVLLMSHRLEVGRIAAQGHTAEMVDFQAVRNRTGQGLIGATMRQASLAVHARHPIADAVRSLGP